MTKVDRTSENRANERNIDYADSGPKSNLAQKLGLIEDYIRNQATLHHQGNIVKVPCPVAKEWARLCEGRGAVLPNEAQMKLFAKGRMHDLAKQMGSMRAAYFAVARYRILNPPSQQSSA